MNNIDDLEHEYCPRCQADLTLQKGYSNELSYWICKGCGEMLINPEVESDSDIAWICDGCEAMLNIQPGFSEDCGKWTCTECGYVNKIDPSQLYLSEDEYQADIKNPYKGLLDQDILSLSLYKELGEIDGRDDIVLVKNQDDGKLYVKKLLTIYNKSVYEYLKDNPIACMPRIYDIYESSNCLIVIEEYIEGCVLSDMIGTDVLKEKDAVIISKSICHILDTLHNLPKPIIHRDIKPSNIVVKYNGEVYLLDMNVAKWYDPDENDDTRYLGTKQFAAPEQVGYGLSASSAKSDIYALGIMLNLMITDKFPKEKRAEGPIWNIIEKCISLNADDRYTASELAKKLDAIEREYNAEETNR